MKLSKKKINETMQELAHLKVQLELLSNDIAEKENLLRDYMDSNQLEVLLGGEHKATYKLVSSDKFNVRALKEEQPKIYKKYLVDNSYMRFTFK